MSDILKWLRIAPPYERHHVREAREVLWIKLKDAADEIERLRAENAKLAASNHAYLSDYQEARGENEKLRAALRDIARQKKTDELDTEYDVEVADFEGGYDSIIDIARAALGEKE